MFNSDEKTGKRPPISPPTSLDLRHPLYLPRKPNLLSSPRLHRSPLLHKIHCPPKGERLPIELSRNFPRRLRPNLPFIPHLQPAPHQLAITSTAAQAVLARHPRRIHRPSPQILSHQSQLHKSQQNQTLLPSTRRSNHHRARPRAKPQPKATPEPANQPPFKKLYQVRLHICP